MSVTDKHTEDLIRRLQEPFPHEAIKTRAGGGNSRLSYVEAHTVIRRLNAASGGRWDFAVLREEREGDLLKATCRLTIPGLGSREHVGVQKVSERGGEDLHKGAITDALKKCATLFGVGLELYGEDYEEEPAPAKPAPSRPQPAPARQNAPSAEQRYQTARATGTDPATNDAPLWGEIEQARQHEPSGGASASALYLEIVRNDEAGRLVRLDALDQYYALATDFADFTERASFVKNSGLPVEDRKEAYERHQRRLSERDGAALRQHRQASGAVGEASQ